MIALLRTIAQGLLSSFRDRASLQLEIIALRHRAVKLMRTSLRLGVVTETKLAEISE